MDTSLKISGKMNIHGIFSVLHMGLMLLKLMDNLEKQHGTSMNCIIDMLVGAVHASGCPLVV